MESDVYLLDSNYFVVHSLGHGYDELRVSSTSNIKLKLVSQKQDNVFYSTKRIAGETYILKRSQKKWELYSYSYLKNKLQPIKKLDKNIWVRSFEVTNKYFVLSILENSFSKIVFIPKHSTDSAFYADRINPLADNFIKINNHKDDIITVYEFNAPNSYEKISIDLNRQSYEKELIKYLKNTSEYECKRLWAESKDKVKIPITIIYKKGLILGIQWYLDGKLKNKPNGIDDLITCSEFLVKEGITNEKQLCLYARSAGGLIVGAAVNKNPKLCKAVVYDKANVDLISSMAQNDFGLKYHYYEYGSPVNKEEYRIMITYSPLQNLPKQYPHSYMIIGLNDKMVNPKSNLNFLRKLDKIDNGSHTILAKIYENEGHQGSPDKQTNLFRTALMYTFIINEIKNKRESQNPE